MLHVNLVPNYTTALLIMNHMKLINIYRKLHTLAKVPYTVMAL